MKPEDSRREGSSTGASSSRNLEHPNPRHSFERPGYMTVGNGSTSQSADALTQMLEGDSGYGSMGGSIADGWHPGRTEDRPTPAHTPLLPGESNEASEQERRALASHTLQQYYNQNRNALIRAIGNTVDILAKFQEMNQTWPAQYPSVHPEAANPHPVRTDPRPGLHHSFSTRELESTPPPRPGPRRAETSLGPSSNAESSSAASARSTMEPRLINAQLAHDYSVLKLELKMAGRNQTDLVHSLERGSIASLLDGQIRQTMRHLGSLRDRVEDTSSKVLVTGDLNAGKSTFCNALLRRKVLPEDQQPCTSIFCEVLDVRENGGIEEVHAIPHDTIYNRNDETTYLVFGLEELEKIVIDCDRFASCKVYVKDVRPLDQSLLNNGTVDIALIDAPGLNKDSLQTTALFARQEEIDVVVFVVSASNHFTQSAADFILSAAREKAYLFTVVNGYDMIRDRERCQQMILKQMSHMSPATFKESKELIHFVSSNAIPMIPGGGPGDDFSSGGGSSGSGFDDPGFDPDDEDGDSQGKHGEPGSPGKGKGKDKGKEREKQRDFSYLEASLRRFVLEKRARSKLAPAKTYLMNLLGDLNSLATFNRDAAQTEFDRVKKELEELEPAYETQKRARTEVGDELDRTLETSTTETYNHTRETLTDSINRVSEQDLGIPYPGPLSALQYAEDIKDAMICEIADTVRKCEEDARNTAIRGFNGIKQLGLLHVGDSYNSLSFHSHKMFMKKRHDLARQVDIDFELLDFFDFSGIWERQEKLAGTGMAVTVASIAAGRVFGGVDWVGHALTASKIAGSGNLRRLIIPGLVTLVACAAAYAVQQIPNSLPRRLATKLSTQLAAQDYVHDNSQRISAEVRRALKSSAHDLRIEIQRGVEKLEEKKEATHKLKSETEGAKKYFTSLVRTSGDIKHKVESVDLEGTPPGLATQYAPA